MEYNEHNLAEPPTKKVKLNSPGPNCGDDPWLTNFTFNDELPDELANGFLDQAQDINSPNQLSQLLSPSASVAVLSSPAPPRPATASLPQSPAYASADSVVSSALNLGTTSQPGMASSVGMNISRPGGMMSPVNRFPSVSQSRAMVQGGMPSVNMVSRSPGGTVGNGSSQPGGSPNSRSPSAAGSAASSFPGNSIIINLQQQVNVSQLNSLQINSSQISNSQMNTVFVNSAQLKGLQQQKNGLYNKLQFNNSQLQLSSRMPGSVQLNAKQAHGVQSFGVHLANPHMVSVSGSNGLMGSVSMNGTQANNAQIGSLSISCAPLSNAIPSNGVQSGGILPEIGGMPLNGQTGGVHLSGLQGGNTSSVQLNNVLGGGMSLNSAQLGGMQVSNGPIGVIPLHLGNVHLNPLTSNMQSNSAQLASQISGPQLQSTSIAGLPFTGAPHGSATPFNNTQLGSSAASAGIPAIAAQTSGVQITNAQLNNVHTNSVHVATSQLGIVHPNASGMPSNGVQVPNALVPSAQFSVAQTTNICLNNTMVGGMQHLKKNPPQVNIQQHLNNIQSKSNQLNRAQFNATIQRGVMQRFAAPAGNNNSATITTGSTADTELSLATSSPLSLGIRMAGLQTSATNPFQQQQQQSLQLQQPQQLQQMQQPQQLQQMQQPQQLQQMQQLQQLPSQLHQQQLQQQQQLHTQQQQLHQQHQIKLQQQFQHQQQQQQLQQQQLQQQQLQPQLQSQQLQPQQQLQQPPQQPLQQSSAGVDPKRRLIQQQLVLLLHAHKCQRREMTTGVALQPCLLPHCQTMKNVLTHMSDCQNGKACTVPHCASSRQIIMHWKNCTRGDCPVCLPLKNACDRPGVASSASVAAGASRFPLHPGLQQQQQQQLLQQQQQPNQPRALHPDMMRAYAALGLTPPTQANTTAPGAYGPRLPSASTMPLPSARIGGIDQNSPSMAASSALWSDVPGTSPQQQQQQHRTAVTSQVLDLPLGGTDMNNALMRSGNVFAGENPNRAVKDWHVSVTSDLRQHLVHKLVQAIYPSPDPKTLLDVRIVSLVQYARKVEGDMYEMANSREEYYHLLAEKIYKIQKDLEEKRKRRELSNLNQSSGIIHPPGSVESGGDSQLAATLGADPSGVSMPDSGRMSMSSLPGCGTLEHEQKKLSSQMSALPFILSNQSEQQKSLYGVMQQQPMFSPSNTSNTDTSLPSYGVATHLQYPQTQQQLQPLQQQQLILQQQHQMQQQMQQQQQTLTHQQQQQQTLTHQQQLQQLQQQQLAQQQLQQQQLQQQQLQQQQLAMSQHQMQMQQQPLQSQQLQQRKLQEQMLQIGQLQQDSNALLSNLNRGATRPLSVGHLPPKVENFTPHNGSAEEVKVKQELTQILTNAEELSQENMMKCSVKYEMNADDCMDHTMTESKAEETPCISSALSAQSSPGNSAPTPCSDPNKSDPGSILPSAGAVATVQTKFPVNKKVWKANKLRQVLMPTLEKLYRQDPDSIPFRQPVNPIEQGIPDYFDIVKNPMDLSTIKRKLDNGQYTDPWQYVDDVWLMFDNAWLYNRKTSKVHKYCSKLAEVFEPEIDNVMRLLGFCCGKRFVFNPMTLICYGKYLCTVPVNATYYSYQNRYSYCEKCFTEIPGNEVELVEDSSQPVTRLAKELFVKTKNSEYECEQLVECTCCGRRQHQICVLHMEQIWPGEFLCAGCTEATKFKKKANKHTAKRLPQTKLGMFLENRVNSFLKKKDAGAGEVVIRVLASSEKLAEIKPGMKERFREEKEMSDNFPYIAKAIFAFEEIDGVDVCFFGMHVQEYGSNCSGPNARRVYLAYMDSVHFFQPKQFRTAVYHEILIGYLLYVKNLGYIAAHIWACPPSEGDDYIFNCHPPDMKIPKQKRLQDWYKKMLDKAIIERVVVDYKDLLKDALENKVSCVTKIPYFDGDYWPNILEECIKEQEQEEDKRRQEEVEAANVDMEEAAPESEENKEEPAGSKKGQKAATMKKKNAKSKSSAKSKSGKKGSQIAGSNDLMTKLFSYMEKLKEGFFVVGLHSQQVVPNLPPIVDPDPFVTNELMDGRDSFLAIAREKHYEFSSLRRARFSSMALLCELHTQAKDSFVYMCNNCKASIETHYHCDTCDDFDLCVSCFQKLGHEHKMEKLGLGLDDSGVTGEDRQQQSAEDARRLQMQRCLQALVHACQCRDANCRLQSCQKMKRIVQHSKSCKRKNNGCSACRQLCGLCCHHAKSCQEARCLVPFCINIRQKLQQKQLQQRLLQAQLMRRRMMAMQMSNQPSAAAAAAQPGSLLPGGIGSPVGMLTSSSYGVNAMSVPEMASKPVGTPPESSLRRPGMHSPSVAGGIASSSVSSSQGSLPDGHIAMMSPQHRQSNVVASPNQQASVMPMDQQSEWKLPHPGPGPLTNDMLRPNANIPAGPAYGQHQSATPTATVAGGQLRLPSPSAQKTSLSSEKVCQILKSTIESGGLNRQQLLSLIQNPTLAEAFKQKLMKQAAQAAAQCQPSKPTSSSACSSTIVSSLQEASRPSPILPPGATTIGLTSQASSLQNCLSPEQQQHQHNMQIQQLQQQQKHLQQLRQHLQQQNLQLIASSSGQQVPRARLNVPPVRPALDSAMAINSAGANLSTVPFSVGRVPQMIFAQNSNDVMQQQQQLQLANNLQGCNDSKPLQSTVMPQVRMLSLAASRPLTPRLTLTLPSRPMHSQLANHAMSSSGFRGDHQNQTNDQSIFAQQASYAMTLDLPSRGHSMTDGDMTPLTPQDQLSRYVEQL